MTPTTPQTQAAQASVPEPGRIIPGHRDSVSAV